MALILSVASGNFNNSATWSGGVVPGAADEARANSHTITITTSVTCSEISNAGTGTFILNGGVTLTANVTHKAATTSTNCLIFSSDSPATATIIGNVGISGTGSTSGNGVRHASSGPLTVTGLINGASAGNSSNIGIGVSGSGILIVNGIVSGGTIGATNVGINNSSTAGTVIVNGIVNGATNVGITNTSTGSVIVYGNLTPTTATCVSNTSVGSITVLGNIAADSRGGVGITSTNAAANVKISGNLIGAPNGIPAVYAASYTVNPVPYQTYIRYANNGTGVGSDAYLYHYTTDSLSAFSMPPLSAVRAGLQYANNTLTGTCEIPAVSAVTFGALVDNTSGTAVLTNNTLFDVSVASLTATDSLGARLKNSATVESVGRIIASF
jgi:hypothetical protein